MGLGSLREREYLQLGLSCVFPPEEVYLFSDLVPAPQHLTLERQLNKSVLIGWTAPQENSHHLESYHVYVDGVLKVTVKATERTRALVEGVDSTRVSRHLFTLFCTHNRNIELIFVYIVLKFTQETRKKWCWLIF